MANKIPSGIRPEHILTAIKDLQEGAIHPFGESTRYDLLFDGHRYPPKAVVGIAAGNVPGGVPLGPYDFKGGLESKCFDVLQLNGFTVVRKEKSPTNPDWTRDELIVALDVYLRTKPTLPGKTSEPIIELSKALNRLGKTLFSDDQRSETFRNPNGVYMKLMNFRRFDPQYTAGGKVGLSAGNVMEEEVWDKFASHPDQCRMVANAILSILDDPEASKPLFDEGSGGGLEEAAEGRLLTRKHLVRERNRTLVQTKINRVLKRTGKLECEVCTFDFTARYGERGAGFIECHHTKFVAILAENAKTHIDDLALVCPNCHRMIHRVRPWLSIQELRALLK